MDAEGIRRLGEPRLEPERFIDAAEQVVIPMRITARDKQTGTPTDFMFMTWPSYREA